MNDESCSVEVIIYDLDNDPDALPFQIPTFCPLIPAACA